MDASAEGELRVAAGVLHDACGRVLIAQRPAGRDLAGAWEFPGGKFDDHEEARAALARELREELGIEVEAAEPLLRYRHAHHGRPVILDVWTVSAWRGEPRPLEGQALRWEAVERLLDIGLLEADRPIVEVLLRRAAGG
jgi:8-oxo-dGTP diphosphatase